MEARIRVAQIFCALTLCCGVVSAADTRTENFIVSAAEPKLAAQVAQEAERLRRELALLWLGEELPRWPQPCPIRVDVDPREGAGGETSFVFDRGQVYNWRMHIFGSRERVLDSVLPHEITHTIFASHFRRPLPRWADEGGCTTVEHSSEKNKHQKLLVNVLRDNRGIPFRRMFAMTEYPRDILPLYAQGFALARYFIEAKGNRAYIKFMEDGLARGDWEGAVKRHYQIDTLGDLQLAWIDWVAAGSPARDTVVAVNTPTATPPVRLASTDTNLNRQRPEPNLMYRGQNDQAPRQPAIQVIDPPLVPLRQAAIASNPAGRTRPGPVAFEQTRQPLAGLYNSTTLIR